RSSYLPLLELATRENSQDARMWTYLARERSFQGDHTGVLKATRQALSLPGWPAERAALCRWTAAESDSEAWLLRGTLEAPHEAEAWYGLARYYYEQQRWPECLETARHGLECPQASHYLADQA